MIDTHLATYEVPLVVRIIKCSTPGAWYEQLIYEDFDVDERSGDNYIVDTWNADGQYCREFSKVSDTKIIKP